MGRLELFGEVWLFFKQNRNWWLFPIVGILLALGGLFVFAGSSALAPFIYTIF